MYECKDDGVCLGEIRTDNSNYMDVMTQCLDSHSGILCSDCLPGYSMTLGVCTLCEEVSSNEDPAAGSTAKV